MGLQDPAAPLSPFLRNLRAVFPGGCTLVHAGSECRRILFPYILGRIHSSEIFLMMAILSGGRGFLSVDLICIDLIVSVKKDFIGPGLHLRPVRADHARPPFQRTLSSVFSAYGKKHQEGKTPPDRGTLKIVSRLLVA